MDAVVTKGLTKKYGDIEALRGVDLSIRQGETFAVLGPNGAGKTTLINILTTMLPPTEGEAWVGGHSVRAEPELVRRSLGVVFQNQTLDSVMTAEENLRIHGQLYKVPRKEIEARIPDLLALAGLEERAKDRVQTYSGGMRRRLEIVRALLQRPKVLLLDEPTVALDPQSRSTIWEYIGKLAKEHQITILLTTHYMEEADRLCDRVAIVDRGTLVALDTPQALKARLGGDRLEVRIGGGDAREALPRVQGLPNVLEAKAEPDALFVRLREPATTIPSVLRAVADSKLHVQEMHHRPSTMDDVFLSETGSAPRDKKRKKRSRIMEFLTGGGA